MDIEKLIERLKAKDFEQDYDCTPFECGVFGLLDDAATALSMLQAKNEKLRAELEQVKKERKRGIPLQKWVHLGGDEWCCRSCGNVIYTEGSWEKPKKKYCEECGAKMDVEQEK